MFECVCARDGVAWCARAERLVRGAPKEEADGVVDSVCVVRWFRGIVPRGGSSQVVSRSKVERALFLAPRAIEGGRVKEDELRWNAGRIAAGGGGYHSVLQRGCLRCASSVADCLLSVSLLPYVHPECVRFFLLYELLYPPQKAFRFQCCRPVFE